MLVLKRSVFEAMNASFLGRSTERDLAILPG
jgi:hypothetical protein